MEPPENGDSGNAPLELGRTRNRLPLVERLVGPRLVGEAHELGDEAAKVGLAEEEDMVEQLPAQGAREAFSERVLRTRASWWERATSPTNSRWRISTPTA